jgi:hypothetical protein
MRAEVDFLRYAQRITPTHVPQVIAVDNKHRCIVMEHLDGIRYPENILPPRDDIYEALSFFKKINTCPTLAKGMIKLRAAEGFLSLRQHMANIRERLSRMSSKHLPPECRRQADKLITRLYYQGDLIEKRLESAICNKAVDDHLDPKLQCISPSDFGFHNAIKTSKGIKFIDFEFAGWDDPTKAAIDFELQPRTPTGIKAKEFLERHRPQLANVLSARCDALTPLLQLKWTCIILAILQEQRFEDILYQQKAQFSTQLIYSRFKKGQSLLNSLI